MTEVLVTNTRHRLSSDQVIRPYAAEDFPDFFEQSDTTVTVLSARRTFWEKATALHAEAHRPAESETPQYFSRHYYDLAMMLDSVEGKAATADLELMATVAKHKADVLSLRLGQLRYGAARHFAADAKRGPDQRSQSGLSGNGADDVR
jgi:hypothetical protein